MMYNRYIPDAAGVYHPTQVGAQPQKAAPAPPPEPVCAPPAPPPPPPGGSAFGWHHPGPRMHHPRGFYRPAPRHHRYYYHSSDWVGPVLFGALLAGTTVAAINASNRYDYDYRTTTQTTETSRPGTRFWCEAEKGYYPDVRACPTGWTPIPAK